MSRLGGGAGSARSRWRLVRRGAWLGVLVYFVAATAAQAVTFSFTGSEQAYVVPAGVTEVAIDAIGAPGGIGCLGTTGGLGGEMTGDFAVRPGSVLFVEVGGPGTTAYVNGFCTNGVSAGGFNGGGAGNAVGGAGGGGASDVRTVPRVDGSSAGSRLLVGGGGGGAGANGGGGGNAGSAGVNGGGGGAGGAGTLETGGAAGSPSCVTAPTAGGFGTGGAGDSQSPNDGGGGGGGGYFGGGGGGVMCGNTAAGGGGGSSYVAPSALAATSATTSASAPSVTITPLSATAQVSPLSLTFATQPQSTVSNSQPVTVTNTGNGPLAVSGLSFAGGNPTDFLIGSSTCGGIVAPGSSCQLTVRFAPQAQGARSATLQIASDTAGGPLTVSLSGTGGQLPQGAAGPPGATGQQGIPGPTGKTGPRGPQGRAGKIELVTCMTVKKRVTKGTGKKRHKVTVTQRKCKARLVSGTVKFTVGGASTTAAVSRGRVMYGTGIAVSSGEGSWQLVLTHQRALRPGRYTLTLRSRHHGRWAVQRRSITIA